MDTDKPFYPGGKDASLRWNNDCPSEKRTYPRSGKGFQGGPALIVCATIVRDGKVLLVRHSCEQKPDYGDWLLPAGSVEPGESLEDALKREVREELSLKVKIIRKLVEHVDPYTGDQLVNFLCSPITSRIEVSDELAEARWFDLNEIQGLKTIHPGLKEGLTKLLREAIPSSP